MVKLFHRSMCHHICLPKLRVAQVRTNKHASTECSNPTNLHCSGYSEEKWAVIFLSELWLSALLCHNKGYPTTIIFPCVVCSSAILFAFLVYLNRFGHSIVLKALRVLYYPLNLLDVTDSSYSFRNH